MIVGDRRKGTILIGIDLAILVGLYLYMGDALTLAKLWLQPSQLAMMMIGNIVLLGYRIWAADDAYRTAKNKGSRNLSPSMGAMLGAGIGLAAVLVLPHVVFGYYDIVQYDLITTVFASSSPSPTQPSREHDATRHNSNGRYGRNTDLDHNTTARRELLGKPRSAEHSSDRR